jgi:hypothetical protein
MIEKSYRKQIKKTTKYYRIKQKKKKSLEKEKKPSKPG